MHHRQVRPPRQLVGDEPAHHRRVDHPLVRVHPALCHARPLVRPAGPRRHLGRAGPAWRSRDSLTRARLRAPLLFRPRRDGARVLRLGAEHPGTG
ncbi:hypothetical protein CCE01nite_10120 [Cellulomonas cellasea]|uniref:Uncharacterized protein n=1 Tax=Cellulomonas cellasea TaxID=43670 RepID=A0A4Y3KSU6_9CELL|nr:hypothetical protein CCE01nite_10120 [Cellulomonas cellasea]